MLNRERLLVTSTKALADVLVNRAYDFAKTRALVASIGWVTGTGVILAEGDVHRVCPLVLQLPVTPAFVADDFLKGPTEELEPCILVPPYQGALPYFLAEIGRDGRKDSRGHSSPPYR